jgi:hypothetical protein
MARLQRIAPLGSKYKQIPHPAWLGLPGCRRGHGQGILPKKMAPVVRFERTTCGLGGVCSILLSYGGGERAL